MLLTAVTTATAQKEPIRIDLSKKGGSGISKLIWYLFRGNQSCWRWWTLCRVGAEPRLRGACTAFRHDIQRGYPQITFINTLGHTDRLLEQIPGDYMVDPHWYRGPNFFFANNHLFDEAPPNPWYLCR